MDPGVMRGGGAWQWEKLRGCKGYTCGREGLWGASRARPAPPAAMPAAGLTGWVRMHGSVNKEHAALKSRRFKNVILNPAGKRAHLLQHQVLQADGNLGALGGRHSGGQDRSGAGAKTDVDSHDRLAGEAC